MEAIKFCKSCGISKTADCFYKDRNRKDGLTYRCKSCSTTRAKIDAPRLKEWRLQNAEKLKQYSKLYTVKNSKIAVKRVDEWRKLNPDKHKLNAAKLRFEKPEYFKNHNRNYAKNNPAKINTKTAQYRALKFRAFVKWANKNAILAIYKKAAELTRITGIKHDVDHCVPLKSDIVCGLHWEGNLQILTRSENVKKSNRYWENMP